MRPKRLSSRETDIPDLALQGKRKPTHWFAPMWGFSKLMMPIPCFSMSAAKAPKVGILCKVGISHLKKKNPHRRTDMSLRGE